MSELEEDLKKLKKQLIAKRESWRSGSFFNEIPLNGWSGFIYDVRILFQKTMAELEELEERYAALKETLKNEYRESITSAEDARVLNQSTDIFKITVRRNYEYDEDYLNNKVAELGLPEDTLYKVTRKFDPKLAPEELEDELKKAKKLKGITTSFKDKWD